VTQALVRFVIGGALVALLPVAADKAGTAVAGVLLLYPAVSLAGLLFIGLADGLPAVASTSIAAVLGIPTVLAFLLSVHYSARSGLPLPLVLTIGTISWFAVATPIVVITRRREGP
jgi:uncharacterized membrane protein (GlpM family)